MIDSIKLDSILGKIHALRKIAQSSNSKPEREAALNMATKLITQYQIEEEQIAIATKKREEDNLDGEVVYETGRSTPWKVTLLSALTRLFNTCWISFPIRDSIAHRRGSRYRLMGGHSDIQITKYMFDTLEEMISNEVRIFIPRCETRGVSPERESWCLGCVYGYIDKMKGERDLALKAAPSSVAMVLVNRTEQISAAYEAKHNITLHKKAKSKAKIVETFNSGYKQGQKMTVNAGLGSSGPAPKLTQ